MITIKYKPILALLVMMAIIVGAALAGCTGSVNTGQNTVKKQTLVIGEVWGMGGVDPAQHSYELNNYLVSEGLTSISPDFQIIPGIADTWELVGDATWRFHLNKNILFHDGSKVTASDVVAALKRSLKMNPDLGGSLNVKDITKVDDYTVDIVTNTPDASTPARMAYGAAGIYKVNEQSDGTISNPICTGPFKFVSYDKASDTLNIAKYDQYRSGAPKLDTITIKWGIGDSNAREMAIQNGEVDFTTEVPIGSTTRLQNDPNLNVIIHPLCQGYKLKFGNVSKGPYDDVNVRKAIAYAIDRQSISDEILLGRGKASDGNALTPGLPWRNNGITGYAYNVQKAKQLLAEAGWKDTNGNGILDKDGKEFKITLYTWPQRPALVPTEQAVQSQLKEIGIDAEARVMEWDAISERKDDWGMIWVGGGDTCMMIPDPSYYIEGNFLSTSNDYGYKNAKVDSLILEARGTNDQQKRYDLYRQVQKIVYDDDCAQIPIAYHYLCVVTDKDVKGYIPNPAHHDYCISTGIYRE